MSNITERLDKIATRLEELNLLKEATEIDTISNTIDAMNLGYEPVRSMPFMPGPWNMPGAAPFPGLDKAMKERAEEEEEYAKQTERRRKFMPGPHNRPGAAPWPEQEKDAEEESLENTQ